MKLTSLIALSCAALVSASTLHAQNADVDWTTGTFTDNAILTLIPTESLLYAVNLGSDNAFTTANSYAFTANDQVNVGLGGGQFNIDGPFNPNPGASVDASFNSILGSATFGSPTYTLKNLQVGWTYEVLLLRTDTRSSETEIPPFNGRTFFATGGSNTSATQQYAFENGGATLGGYIYGTFVATDVTQIISVDGSADGGMLNGIVVGVTAVPEPAVTALLVVTGLLGLVVIRRHKARNVRA